MHDIDRTQAEFEPETDDLETEGFEFEDDFLSDTEFETDLSDSEEMELAEELLGISSEPELDQFLGKVFKRVWRGIRKIPVIGRIAKPLGGILKGVAKKLLPVAAGAAGTFFGGPVGGALGSKLGSMVSSALEMELEAINPEDQEFEVARRFVRLAGTAAKQAAALAQSTDPQTAARNAVVAAAKKHIPNLAAASSSGAAFASPRGGRAGRWVRRGNKIVLFGV